MDNSEEEKKYPPPSLYISETSVPVTVSTMSLLFLFFLQTTPGGSYSVRHGSDTGPLGAPSCHGEFFRALGAAQGGSAAVRRRDEPGEALLFGRDWVKTSLD